MDGKSGDIGNQETEQICRQLDEIKGSDDKVEILENLVYILSGGDIIQGKQIMGSLSLREVLIWFGIIERNQTEG